MNRSMIKCAVLALALSMAVGAGWGRLPPLSEEQKAKAEAAKANAADAARKEAELLTKAQDRVAGQYIKAQKAKGVTVKPTPIAAPASAPGTAAPAKK